MKPKILLLSKSVKSYWATEFAEKKITSTLSSKDSSWLWLFFTALRGWQKSPKFDLVISADARIGIFYGFIRSLFGGKTPILVSQLILPDFNNSLLWKAKNAIEKFSFKSIEGVIVNSSSEVSEYKRRLCTGNTNFYFIHIPAENFWFDKNLILGERKYIFSGGGEKRDFDLLFKVAERIPVKFKIVTFSRKNVSGYKIPSNCEIMYQVPNKDYLDLIGNSLFVVIPLKKTVKSAGQTTLVQSMCQKKAVVIAKNPAILDYISNNVDGIFYNPGDDEDLVIKINLLINNNKMREAVGKNALLKAQETFSYKRYNEKIEEIIKSICPKV